MKRLVLTHSVYGKLMQEYERLRSCQSLEQMFTGVPEIVRMQLFAVVGMIANKRWLAITIAAFMLRLYEDDELVADMNRLLQLSRSTWRVHVQQSARKSCREQPESK